MEKPISSQFFSGTAKVSVQENENHVLELGNASDEVWTNIAYGPNILDYSMRFRLTVEECVFCSVEFLLNWDNNLEAGDIITLHPESNQAFLVHYKTGRAYFSREFTIIPNLYRGWHNIEIFNIDGEITIYINGIALLSGVSEGRKNISGWHKSFPRGNLFA